MLVHKQYVDYAAVDSAHLMKYIRNRCLHAPSLACLLFYRPLWMAYQLHGRYREILCKLIFDDLALWQSGENGVPRFANLT